MKKKKVISPAEPFDLDGAVAENLKKDKAFRREYLKDLLTERDIPFLAASLKPVVQAMGGVGKLSKETGLGRQSLYKALSGKVLPDFPTLIKILNFAGYDLDLKERERHTKRAFAHA